MFRVGRTAWHVSNYTAWGDVVQVSIPHSFTGPIMRRHDWDVFGDPPACLWWVFNGFVWVILFKLCWVNVRNVWAVEPLPATTKTIRLGLVVGSQGTTHLQ